ncbi:MAG: hypothetical protein AVDCRST_MAG93-9550 [uncultured Chloroflexia bacterium]|uniref:Transcriptional regulator, IclR family n=1 Tax=uncultured Chloroflexia bacterium TaxID=1672391 RepID=A0A6J4NGP5_9CHLR|nr:MAG: hypothetical protein AVDCRST_MAG93-9550 [uncultured Chloroflexia bacterium]
MNTPAVKSAERVIRIFECFRDKQHGLSAKEISDQLRLPGSSTFVLLRSMVHIGYLHFDPTTREYYPTLLVTELGSWIPTFAYGLNDPRMLIETIRDATGETVTLSVQNNLSMQILDTAIGTQMIVLNIRTGDKLPLLISNIGRVSLSLRSDDEIAKLLKRAGGGALGGEPPPDIDSLMSEIAHIRKRGYGVGYDSVIAGLGAIAWPIDTNHPARTLVIALAGPTDRIRNNEKTIVNKVKAILKKHAPRR